MEKNQPPCERCGMENHPSKVCLCVDKDSAIPYPCAGCRKLWRYGLLDENKRCPSCQEPNGKECGLCEMMLEAGTPGYKVVEHHMKNEEHSHSASMTHQGAGKCDICHHAHSIDGNYTKCEECSCPAGQPPTPGEDWEDGTINLKGKDFPRWELELNSLLWKTSVTDEEHLAGQLEGSRRFITIKSFIHNLLSSHESKAREEGRKEGAEAVVKAVEEAMEKSFTHKEVSDAARSALSQTNPKKE